MNQNEAFNRICRLFEAERVEFRVLDHPPCRTSKESAAARAQAGAPEAVGAKAVLCRMEFYDRHAEYNVLVLPGPSRVDTRALKSVLPDLRRYRFATVDEMQTLCHLSPGAMPPFAQSVFPQLNHLYVDRSLLDHDLIGFNAGSHERSIVVRSQDYIRAALPTAILDYAAQCS